MTAPGAPPVLVGRAVRLGVAGTTIALLLAACASTNGGATVGNVAWVATDASVTLPGDAITPVNLSTKKAQPAVPVGSLPSAMAFNLDDSELLVVSQGDDTLHEVDPDTDQVLHSVTVGEEPDAVAVAPGGTDGKGIALVANVDSNTVTPVDLGTWKVMKPIAVGQQPVAIVVVASSATVGTVFVADFGSNEVTPIDLAQLQAGAPIPVGPGPETLAAVGTEVLVGNFSNSTLTPINAVTLQALTAIALPINPTDIVVANGGGEAYVTGGNSLLPISLPALTVGTPIKLPDVSEAVALNAPNTVAWVALQGGSLIPVSLHHGIVGRAIHLGGHPSAVAIAFG
jgi:YVTN family beta-propeller protein